MSAGSNESNGKVVPAPRRNWARDGVSCQAIRSRGEPKRNVSRRLSGAPSNREAKTTISSASSRSK
jgi:hypothetical protein